MKVNRKKEARKLQKQHPEMAAQIPGALLGVNYYRKDNGFGLRRVGATIRTIIMFLLLFFKTPFMATDSAVTSPAECVENLCYRVTPSTQNVLKRKAFSTVLGFGEYVDEYQAVIYNYVTLVL